MYAIGINSDIIVGLSTNYHVQDKLQISDGIGNIKDITIHERIFLIGMHDSTRSHNTP